MIIKKSLNRKSISIKVTPSGKVIVSAPWFVPDFMIKSFVDSKRQWIKECLKVAKKNRLIKPTYSDGEPQLFLGEFFPLFIRPIPYIQKSRLGFDGRNFELTVPKTHTPREIKTDAHKCFLDFYLKYGRKYLFERVSFYTQKLNVYFNRLVLKKVSSIWGSCSSKNNLNFNRKLIMAPKEVVDYVVIHEVCHLIHRHHRRTFWQLVKSLDPEYHLHKLWLSNNHQLLTI